MLSRAHFPCAYKLLCPRGYFSHPRPGTIEANTFGGISLYDHPLHHLILLVKASARGKARIVSSFAVERREEELEKSFETLRIKEGISLAKVKLRRDFSMDFGGKQIAGTVALSSSQRRHKFDNSLIAQRYNHFQTNTTSNMTNNILKIYISYHQLLSYLLR